MLLLGVLGLLAAAIGFCLQVESPKPFAGLWLGTAAVAVTSAFLLVRRQAIKDNEPFWSPPTYRVGQALLPPLLSGMFVGGILATLHADWAMDFPMALGWMLFYGCALHSAGFFMVRGIKWFGSIFIVIAIVLMLAIEATRYPIDRAAANLVMGAGFGGLHFAYGVYLYFTERKQPAA
jgi:hypothetical protein